MKDYKYEKLTPFKWFVLQNFPFIDTDFDAITNYQLFCKLGEKINKLIESQNNVGQEMESISTAFNNLVDYVNSYFDNLNVQDEINNKLDDMVEQGTLQEIMADYLNSKAVFGFDNVASLKNSTNLIDGSYAETLGYYNKNDGGSALYKIRKITNNDVINEMNIIELNDESDELIAELVVKNNTVNLEMLGAHGDGIEDDSSYLTFALTNYNVVSNKKYSLTGNFNCHGHNLKLKEIVGSPTFSNNSDNLNPVSVSIDKGSTITLQDFKNSKFYIGYATTVNITVSENNSSAFAYNYLEGGQWNNLYIYGNSTLAWINENIFNNTRITTNLSIIGTGYSHNNNKFYNITIEDSTTVTLTKTFCNYFSYRGETFPTVSLSSDQYTYGNVFFRDWASAKGLFINSEDKIKKMNIFKNADYAYLNNYILYSAPSDKNGNINLPSYTVLKTIYINPKNGGAIRFNSDSETFRIRVTPLDTNGNPYDTDPHVIFSSNVIWDNTNKYYTRSVNANNAYFSINDEVNVAKLKLEVYNYSAGTATYAVVDYSTLRPAIAIPEETT